MLKNTCNDKYLIEIVLNEYFQYFIYKRCNLNIESVDYTLLNQRNVFIMISVHNILKSLIIAEQWKNVQSAANFIYIISMQIQTKLIEKMF